MSHTSRRAFLRHAAAMSSLGAAAPLGLSLGAMSRAAAQSSTAGNYKALVCIFMSGGNDGFNTVLANDADSWAHYLNHRDPQMRNPQDTSPSIALLAAGTPATPTAASSSPSRLGGVLGITHTGRIGNTGRQFALHPALKQVQQLYQSGRVAVLSNVGPLTRPTTKADYADVRMSKPAKLFSHNDQQSTWQSFKPEGANAGWGGRMGDLLMAGNGASAGANAALIQRSFTCMTPSGSSVWMTGNSVLPYQNSATGVTGLGYYDGIYHNRDLHTAVSAVMSGATSKSLFASDHKRTVTRALQAYDILNNALPALGQGPWSTSGATNPSTDPLLRYVSPIDGASRLNPLALQLQMVARLIDANRVGGLGIQRQFFMVNLGGFDFHANQISEQADRMAQLNHAMAYFDTVLGGMPSGNLRSQVTTFTASDFGRGFTSNGDGTDHGWGNHHFIMGGAVRGTDVYGRFPQYSTADAKGVFSSPDQIVNGVMLPTTSVDQYAYTLGKWMGVSGTDLAGILPNLNQFNSSAYDLGFMG